MSEKNKGYQRFGKYLILDHLVDGGMAKICRARFIGEQANKLVAIKMIQPQFSKDPAFVKMFEDELKVTFGLLHPNIVQVYDYGLVDNQLYTAMEYVDGKNLKEYLDRLKSKNFVFPVEISIYIISQVCQALHYAHTFADQMTGKKLNIVHRDISPHNIMLTFDGAVKVIDFGIAKADSNSEATQAGTIKGKLSYLAPEYLDGLSLDPRYDEFAVGITLWELLCSRKLFTAKNDLAVLKQIQACKIPPPSTINPNVPKELDQIVLKALSKDRNQRFEDMDKFNRALVKFLYSTYPDFNATDLNYFAKQLFKEEISRNQKKYVEFGKVDITPYMNELEQNGTNGAGVSAVSGGLGQATQNRTGRIEIDLKVKEVDATGLALDNKGKLKPRTQTGLRAPKLEGDETRAQKIPKKLRAQKSKSRHTIADKSGRKSGTRSTLGRIKSEGGASAFSSLDSSIVSKAVGSFFAAMLLMIFFAPSLVYNITGVDIGAYLGRPGQTTNKRDISSEASLVEIEETRKIKNTGQINLLGFDSSLDVYLDGAKVAMKGIDIIIPLDKKVKLEIKKEGFQSFVKEGIIATKDKAIVNIPVPKLIKMRIGLLSTSNNYTSGSRLRYKFDDQVFVKDLPLKNLRIPAGTYDAEIENPLLGTQKKVQFTIEENKKTFLD